MRDGVVQLLRAGGCEVRASLEDADSVRPALASFEHADALVLDIRMPPTHSDEGLALLEQLRADGGQTCVLLLSMYASPTLALRAAAASARSWG